MVRWSALVLVVVCGACGGNVGEQTAPPAAEPATAAPAEGAKVSEKKLSEAAQQYDAQCKADLAKANELFTKIEAIGAEKAVATVLEPLNQLLLVLDRGANDSALMHSVHPEADLRELAERCEQDFQKIATNIGLSRPFYEAVVALDVSKEDAVTQRYVKNLLRDFRRAGVDKEPATRETIRKLKDELVVIGQEFGKNWREDVRSITVEGADLVGLPQDYIDAHKPGADGKIKITTDYPDYVPFMTYAKNDARRKELYVAFRMRGYPSNVEVLKKLIATRAELAALLGYKSWAQYITEDKMIRTDDAARTFINKVNDLAAPRAKKDYAELLAVLKKDLPTATEVGDWQKAYVDEVLKKSKYAFDSQEVRQFFPYENVKNGVFGTVSKLFGVTFHKVDRPVWHSAVEAYEMKSGDQVIGKFFLDMHPRADKYKHAAAFPIRTGVKGTQVPEAALVCNFAGGDGTAGLMEHDDVETFFHEFGHLIHHLFGGEHRWVGVSGFNTEWDFVEAPSQFLEEWAWSYEGLKTFAKNEKGVGIPEALVKKMNRARDFGKGLQMKHQMFYAMLSLSYYDRDPASFDTTELMKELQTKYSPFKYVDGTYFQYSFGHLDGYSAIYYTYAWSQAIAKDLFSVFEKKGMWDANTALRYRQSILEPGGSKDAAVMVKDFLGRETSFDAFAKWMNKDS